MIYTLICVVAKQMYTHVKIHCSAPKIYVFYV